MPVLHLVCGPNGAGKTTFYRHILKPATHLPFVNADEIAQARWPGAEEAHGYQASQAAAEQRDSFIAQRKSFAAETVFSHRSKLELIVRARQQGYLVSLHVVLVPEDLTATRVRLRVQQGGHSVPEQKVRERYRRLWPLVREAMTQASDAWIYDNSSAARPYREVARYFDGVALYPPDWPAWTPAALKA